MALVVDMDDADAFRRYSADAGHQQILNELILPACTRAGRSRSTARHLRPARGSVGAGQ